MARRARPISEQLENPLTDDDLRDIERAERMLHDLAPVVAKAENCGMECQHFREVMEALSKDLAAFKANFFSTS